MPTDEKNVAFPKLYGAPAYARPPAPVETGPRLVDPDDLPLEVHQTEEERSIAAGLQGREYMSIRALDGSAMSAGKTSHPNGANGRAGLLGRPFRLRSLAGRLLGGDR